MSKPAKSGLIRRGKSYVRKLDGAISLHGEVSLCVFMHERYPLQVTVTLKRHTGESLGDACAVDRLLTAETATEGDVTRLLAAVQIFSCRRCLAPAFDPATVETNRDGLCEACFLADLNAEFARHEEAEQLQLAERDQQQKSAGMKVRVSAWIHPDEGDDYQVNWYFAARPPAKQIKTLLQDEGSEILDDYQVINL